MSRTFATPNLSPVGQGGSSLAYTPWRRIRDTRTTHVHQAAGGSGAGPTSASPTANLVDDVYYCAEWAEANYILVNDQRGKPVALLTPASVHACANTAVAALVSSGSNLRSLWSIEDLLAFDNFQRIADNCSDLDTLSVLIAIARNWVKVSSVTMAQIEEAYRSKILF